MDAQMSTPPKQAALYLRISLDKTGEGLGVERQEGDARKLAQLRGWSVADDHLIVENSVSAAGKKQREGFEQLLELISSGQVQVVVAWNLDRLTRNRRDTLRLIELGQQHRITIALCRGSDFDMSTPSGRMTADILAAIARGEIETMSDRMITAYRQAAEKGIHIKGRRPFGFEPDGLTHREPEARAVREAYQLILDGSSLGEVARRWNAAGFETPQAGRAWAGNIVGRTLRLPRMAGLRGYHKRLLEVDGQPVKAEFPEIVDLETWQAAQMILNNPARRTSPTFGNQMLLTGVAVCGICGAGIHAGDRRRSGQRYRCSSGSHVHRFAKPVNDYVTQAILYRLQRPDAADLFEAPSDDAATAKLRRQLRQKEQRFDQLPDLFSDGVVTADELKAQRGKLRTQIAQLQIQLPAGGTRPRAVQALVTSEDVEASWAQLSIESRRDIIGALAKIILYPAGPGVSTIKPGQVVIEWRTG